MKKSYLLLLTLLLAGCTNNNTTNSNQETNSNKEEISSSESVVESEDTSMIEGLEYELFLDDVYDFNMFVNQTYDIKNVLDINANIKVRSSNEEVVEFKDNKLVAKKEGKATIYYVLNGYYQDIKINVAKNDLDAATFKFDIGNLKGKNIIAIGDSVTADETIGCAKTYPNLFKEEFEMTSVKNYAIGGTTATYMYEGSNIYKEYATNTTAIDGCRVVDRAYNKKELGKVDYAFIAFGHNDQYFQAPLDNEDTVTDGDGEYISLENCRSFKASYRFMIRKLRKANPNMRIVILNCTYSEYDKSADTYGHAITYSDYRNAIKEVAKEMNCRYVDPWDYLKPYFKNEHSTYYKDVVHLTIAGQKLLFDYIITK